MATRHGRRLLVAHELLGITLQAFAYAAQAVQLAGEELGLLVGSAVDFVLEPIGGALRGAPQLHQGVDGIERPAAGFRVHPERISKALESSACRACAARRVVSGRRLRLAT